jgi:hypothetical protein
MGTRFQVNNWRSSAHHQSFGYDICFVETIQCLMKPVFSSLQEAYDTMIY